MFKRFELHNHTTESDASITCQELVDIMERDHADVFALTDHNTISGHRIVKKILAENDYRVSCVYGMEYTTYYGHILCLNLSKYVPWDSINRRHPELLFEACQASGALTGVAHPFSYGDPFARGCRFDMVIRDFSHVDFIEIFNNPEPLREVNARGIDWWQELTLKGEKLAVTAGMDLHGDSNMGMCFATYLEGEPDGDPAAELETAIKTQRTWISSGMLLTWQDRADGIHFDLVCAHKPGYVGEAPYFMTLTGCDGEKVYEIGESGLTLPRMAGVQIPKLYAKEVKIENLVCVSPVIRS